MSVNELINLLSTIKTHIQQLYWPGIKQGFTSFKNTLDSITNPVVKELSDLQEFVKALEELISIEVEQGKMIFQAKLEFLEVKIFVLENSLGKIPDAIEDEQDLLETLEILGVDDEEIQNIEVETSEPKVVDITASMAKKTQDMMDQVHSLEKLNAPSLASPSAPGSPTARSGPPKPMTGVPKPMAGPPKAMGPPKPIMSLSGKPIPKPLPSAGPPKTFSGPPKPMTGPPKPMTGSSRAIEAVSPETTPATPTVAPPPSKRKQQSKKESSFFHQALKDIRSEEELEEITHEDAEKISEGEPAKDIAPSKGALSTLQRNTRISYYNQMNPDSNYILRIKISKKEIEKIQSGEVSHVYSSFEVEKTEDKLPIVKIVPFFPGCLVTPQQAEVNIEEELIDVVFYITPLVIGPIDSFVEFWYEGKRIDTVDTPTQIVTQTLTKVVATAGIVTGAVPAGLEFLNVDANAYLGTTFSQYWPGLTDFFSVYGILILEIIIVASLIGVALFLFLKKKPKETEVES